MVSGKRYGGNEDVCGELYEKYGHAPDQFAAAAYDGVYMAMDAVQRAGSVTDTRKIRDAMAAMKGFNGVCGTFSFDAKRDPVVDLVLLKMEDGVFLAVGETIIMKIVSCG